MESTLDRATAQLKTQVTKFRWALGLNGVLAIAVGVVIIAWPGISLDALTILFGAYSLATGGVIVFVWPGISQLALLYVIAVYAIALGILTIAGAFWLPVDGGDTALLFLSGLVAIAFGVVMFANPSDGALVLLSLIAAFALIVGITELVVAIGGKRIVQGRVKRTLTPQAG
jgi:uncharacterized membrane protein HdeD (DUF308 family)